MNQQPSDQEVQSTKQTLRRRAYDARTTVTNKATRSRQAIGRLLQLDSYQRATTILWYVDCRSELRTQWTLPKAIESGKQIVVPYCTVNEAKQPMLGLWRLTDLNELITASWNILAPPPERWQDAGRTVAATELDCVVVPGVAFSRQGVRLGNGQGYYDRLLAQVRRDCARIGLCYEAQLFADLPAEPHDVLMDLVVTEHQVYRGMRAFRD